MRGEGGVPGVLASAVMDHVYIVLILLAPCSVLCSHIPAPGNLTMDSRNFVHVLMWQAGPGSPAGVHYRVTFRTYRNGWRTVDSCVAVHYPLLCNLTDVFSNQEETYYINVTAVLGNKTSRPQNHKPFTPFEDTELEPPSLRVSPCNDSLCVYLRSPSERLDPVYKKLHYVLNVTNEKGVQFLRNTIGLDTVNLKVVPGLNYCVTVSITSYRYSSKPSVCASIPAAVNYMDSVISVVLVLVLMVALIVGLLGLKWSINLKTLQPFVLSSFKAPYKLQLMLWPSMVSIQHVSLELTPNEDVQVSEEEDQDKENQKVIYVLRRGDEEICPDKLTKGAQICSSKNPVTEPDSSAPRSFLKGHPSRADMISRQYEETSVQITSQSHSTNHNTSVQELKMNDLAMVRRNGEDELGQDQEDNEADSDDVNFFSLTLGGQVLEQQEEKMENAINLKPKVILDVLEPPNLSEHVQLTSTNALTSYSEEEKQDDTEEEDVFTGYMMRS